jgi:hypothetical protein
MLVTMQTPFTKDQIHAAFMALDPAAQDAVLSEEVNAPIRAAMAQVPLTPEQQKLVGSLTTSVLVGLLPQSALEVAFGTDTRID